MKKLFALLAVMAGFAAASLSAADFTGTVIWKMRFDITDPEMKAQMDAQQRQMSDPEAQAQMKAAQEAMNSPEMQEMMKANPEMKKMMEAQMQAMSKPGGINNLLPKGFTLQIKGPRSLVKTEGGLGGGDVLTLADKNIAYQIDREARTYRKINTDAAADTMDGKFKVTPTGKTMKVLGYLCRNFLIETTQGDGQMVYSVWATEGIKGLDAQSLRRLSLGKSSGANFFTKIEGVPLKIEGTTPQMTFLMEATSVKSESLPDSLFAVPDGFKELPAL